MHNNRVDKNGTGSDEDDTYNALRIDSAYSNLLKFLSLHVVADVVWFRHAVLICLQLHHEVILS